MKLSSLSSDEITHYLIADGAIISQLGGIGCLRKTDLVSDGKLFFLDSDREKFKSNKSSKSKESSHSVMSTEDFFKGIEKVLGQASKQATPIKIGVDELLPHKYVSYMEKLAVKDLEVVWVKPTCEVELSDLAMIKKYYHYMEMATVFGMGEIAEGSTVAEMRREMVDYLEAKISGEEGALANFLKSTIEVSVVAIDDEVKKSVAVLGEKPLRIVFSVSLMGLIGSPSLKLEKTVAWRWGEALKREYTTMANLFGEVELEKIVRGSLTKGRNGKGQDGNDDYIWLIEEVEKEGGQKQRSDGLIRVQLKKTNLSQNLKLNLKSKDDFYDKFPIQLSATFWNTSPTEDTSWAQLDRTIGAVEFNW